MAGLTDGLLRLLTPGGGIDIIVVCMIFYGLEKGGNGLFDGGVILGLLQHVFRRDLLNGSLDSSTFGPIA